MHTHTRARSLSWWPQVALYLDAGSPVDAMKAAVDNQTALEAAAKLGRGDAIQVLLEHGADVDRRKKCNPERQFDILVVHHPTREVPEDECVFCLRTTLFTLSIYAKME